MPAVPRNRHAAGGGAPAAIRPRRFFLFVLAGITVVLFVRSTVMNGPTMTKSTSSSLSFMSHSNSQSQQRAANEGDDDNDSKSLEARLQTMTKERDTLAIQVNEFQQQQQQQQQVSYANVTAGKVAQDKDDSRPQGAFPYRLTCPGDALPATPGVDYTIALAYHVGMINNWKTIVRDQMNTLHECGLGAAASDFILSHSGGPLEDIQKVLRPYNLFVLDTTRNNTSSFSITASSNSATTITTETSSSPTRGRRRTIVVKSTKVPWEGPIMNQIREYCIAQEAITPKKPTIVFYFHNKGASKYQPNWQTSNGKYKKTLYWRKYMEYYLHERPNLCLNELLYSKPDGGVRPGMCGIMWHRTHYSGNFWSANCHYIATALQPIDMSVNQGYIAGELWIGKGQNVRKDGHRPVSLHENPSGIGLYKHAVEPREYSDYHMRWWKSNLANLGGTAANNISTSGDEY